MVSANQKISLRQLQILIVLDAFGAGMLTLPRRAADYAAQDSWLIIIGLTLLALLCGALTASAARESASSSFMDYAGRVLTKPASYFFGTLLSVKIIICAGLTVRLFALIMRQMMLPNTPTPVVCAVFVALGAYTAAKGIETRARVGELVILPMLLVLFIFLTLALFNMDFSNFAPVMTTPPSALLNGSFRLGFVFTGLEGILLIYPYLQKPMQGRRAIMQALALTGVLWLMITASAIGKFGPEDLRIQPWPVLRLMEMLAIPGSFIERQDALVMSFWIVTVFANINASLFFSGTLVKDLFRRGRHATHVCICAFFILGISCLPFNAPRIEWLLDLVYYGPGLFYLIIFPAALLVVSRLRGLGKNKVTTPMRRPEELL